MMVFKKGDGPGEPTGGFVAGADDNDVRLLLSVGFSILFAITVFAAIGFTLWPGRDAKTTWEVVKEMLGVLLPAETGLLGSILGFYFGSKSSTDAQRFAMGEHHSDAE